MGTPNKHIMIIAGEVSGDIHASLLVKELKLLDPSLTFSGLGGPRMEEQGVTLSEDLTKIAVVGFVEVLKNYSRFKTIFDSILKEIKESRPTAVILVDYPGFNLRLAREVKKLGIKVIYYISPQVWAWKKSRIKLIRRVVDKMLVFFKFEKDLYAENHFPVEWVGHPLIEHVQINKSKPQILASLGWNERRMTIGILPGSREKEVENILPAMLDTAQILHKQYNLMQFLVLKAPSISYQKIAGYLQKRSMPFRVMEHSYDYLNACDVCMVASGTATLETAILLKPMVVVYRTSFLTWALARMLIRIPYIGLVNVVAGKKIVPECVQFQANGKSIAKELRAIFSDEVKIAEIKAGLKKVKESLGAPGASRRAAEEILLFIPRF